MREPSQSPLPKSACTPESPIDAISVAELAATGSLSTRWFHAFVAGNTGQPPIFGGVGVGARRGKREQRGCGGQQLPHGCRSRRSQPSAHALNR